jgi:GTP-binding protein LepA
MANGQKFVPTEVGFFGPERKPTEVLRAGEVGYVATGLKNVELVGVGDTITLAGALDKVTALPGYQQPQPMVYLELYPLDGESVAYSVLRWMYSPVVGSTTTMSPVFTKSGT